MNDRNLFLVLVLVVLVSGCVDGQTDVSSVAETSGQIQSFMEDHPNADMSAVRWSSEYIEDNIDEVVEECRPSIDMESAHYRVEVDSEDEMIVAWTDAEEMDVICAIRESKEVEEETDSIEETETEIEAETEEDSYETSEEETSEEESEEIDEEEQSFQAAPSEDELQVAISSEEAKDIASEHQEYPEDEYIETKNVQEIDAEEYDEEEFHQSLGDEFELKQSYIVVVETESGIYNFQVSFEGELEAFSKFIHPQSSDLETKPDEQEEKGSIDNIPSENPYGVEVGRGDVSVGIDETRVFEDRPRLGDENGLKIANIEDLADPFTQSYYRDTVPEIIDGYVETGDVSMYQIYFNIFDLRTANTLECVLDEDLESYWIFHSHHLEHYDQIKEMSDSEYYGYVESWADELGIYSQSLSLCVRDNQKEDEISEMVSEVDSIGAEAAPTVVIGEGVVEGAESYESFREVIDSELDGFEEDESSEEPEDTVDQEIGEQEALDIASGREYYPGESVIIEEDVDHLTEQMIDENPHLIEDLGVAFEDKESYIVGVEMEGDRNLIVQIGLHGEVIAARHVDENEDPEASTGDYDREIEIEAGAFWLDPEKVIVNEGEEVKFSLIHTGDTSDWSGPPPTTGIQHNLEIRGTDYGTETIGPGEKDSFTAELSEFYIVAFESTVNDQSDQGMYGEIHVE